MQRLIFEYSPGFLFVCLGLGVGYAWILYRTKHSWGKVFNRILSGIRAVLVFLIAVLLLGPIFKQTLNYYEKPEAVILIDNSQSIAEVIDSVRINRMIAGLGETGKELETQGFSVSKVALNQATEDFKFNSRTSDLSGALRQIENDFDGRNLNSVILLSDGIYNSGISPLFSSVKIPVYAIGWGDTVQHDDLLLKNLSYNKIAYQGNKFPLRAEVIAFGLQGTGVAVTVSKAGRQIMRQTKNASNKSFLEFEFILEADQQGVQKYEVAVEPVAGELNRKNNRAIAFIEVVEGRKNILWVAPAPHPDLKALRSVIEKNPNYEVVVHIPGVEEASQPLLQPDKVDLVIFHQSPDTKGITTRLLDQFIKSSTPVMVILGGQTSLRQFSTIGVPLNFEMTGQWDESFPVVGTSFNEFYLPEETAETLLHYPPLNVPFGKFTFPQESKIILYQRIGNVPTQRPMLFVTDHLEKRVAILTGEGIWRWRLHEFEKTDKTLVFDELFSKLIQYLSTKDDKRKFRCFPLSEEFSDAGPVVMETQVYNDIFEPVYGNTIRIELTDEAGKKTNYQYTTSPAQSRYVINNLPGGVYTYRAVTDRNGNPETDNGRFIVLPQQSESQHLTADFGLLRSLSQKTGGKFLHESEVNQVAALLKQSNAKSKVRAEETFSPLIDLRIFFFILLTLVTVEWFLRKYLGSY